MQAIVETLFDTVYLFSVITIGILMIRKSKGNRQFTMFGIMAVLLGSGDADDSKNLCIRVDRINRLQGNGKRNSVRCKLSKKVCSPLGPLCEGDSPRCGEMSRQRQRGPGPKGSARRRWGRELCGCPKYFGL